MKENGRIRFGIATILVALVSVGVVNAGPILFVQTTPQIPQSAVVSMCDNLAGPNYVSKAAGFVILSCVGMTHAFHSFPNATSRVHFVLPVPYTSAIVYPITSSTDVTKCASISGAWTLLDNAVVYFPTYRAEWNYCLDYVISGNLALPSFDIAWEL